MKMVKFCSCSVLRTQSWREKTFVVRYWSSVSWKGQKVWLLKVKNSSSVVADQPEQEPSMEPLLCDLNFILLVEFHPPAVIYRGIFITSLFFDEIFSHFTSSLPNRRAELSSSPSVQRISSAAPLHLLCALLWLSFLLFPYIVSSISAVLTFCFSFRCFDSFPECVIADRSQTPDSKNRSARFLMSSY